MKTVKLVFVVDDDNDVKYLHQKIQRSVKNQFNSFPIFKWNERESTVNETKWRGKHDKEKED